MNDENRDRARLFWALQITGWSVTVLVALAIASVGVFPLRDALSVGSFRAVFGFAVTSALRYPYRLLNKSRAGLWWKGAAVAVACGAAGLGDTLATGAFVRSTGIDVEAGGAENFLAAGPFLRGILYSLWSVFYFAITYRLDTERAQLQLARANEAARSSELRLLRAQVHPHFLFNALNSILAAANDPAAVRAITLALANYLRYSFERLADIEPLGVELAALENYLRVEKVRFDENLEYLIEADPDARRAPVHGLILQPLIENAIKYGQRSAIRPLRVRLTASVIDGMLTVRVVNSGEWIPPESHTSTKTGLANLKRRLMLHYGERASLETVFNERDVCVIVRLPVGEAISKS